MRTAGKKPKKKKSAGTVPLFKRAGKKAGAYIRPLSSSKSALFVEYWVFTGGFRKYVWAC